MENMCPVSWATTLPLWLPYGPRHPLQEITKSVAKRAQVHSDSAPFDLRATLRMHDTVRRTSKLVRGKRLLHFFHVADTGAGRFLRPATKQFNLAADAGCGTHGHDTQVAAKAREDDHQNAMTAFFICQDSHDGLVFARTLHDSHDR